MSVCVQHSKHWDVQIGSRTFMAFKQQLKVSAVCFGHCLDALLWTPSGYGTVINSLDESKEWPLALNLLLLDCFGYFRCFSCCILAVGLVQVSGKVVWCFFVVFVLCWKGIFFGVL